MKTIIISCAITVAIFVLTVSGDVTCKFGWTQDSDEDVEGWSGECADDETTEKCNTAECVGVCFKARYEGEDNFIDIYGCVNNTDGPADEDSWVPKPYDVNILQLHLLPSAGECATSKHEIMPTLPEGATALGLDVGGEWCSCEENECNSASTIHVSMTLIASITAALYEF